MVELVLDKCPKHPGSSGESQYGGRYCWGADRSCKWAVREFVNEQENGDLEKVTKWRLPSGGKYLTQEDYITALDGPAAAEPPSAAPEPPAPATATDRETLIIRQVALKAAVAALGPHPVDTKEQGAWASRLVYLASLFEDWVNR